MKIEVNRLGYKEINDQATQLMTGSYRLGDEERTVMHLVPAAAVKLMKRRVLSRPGVRAKNREQLPKMDAWTSISIKIHQK